MLVKRLLLFFPGVFFFLNVNAQTIENVRIEQDEDKINIHYRIGESFREQLYTVGLSCSIDGAPVFVPKSVFGDVGENISGGKSYYTIVWDVFKELDEVGAAEFFIEIELISDKAPLTTFNSGVKNEKYPIERDFFVGYGGGTWHPFGIRGGSLGELGFYGSARYGGYDDYNPDDAGYMISLTAGVTKNFLSNQVLRIHGYAGGGVGDRFDVLEVEGGVIAVLNQKVNINVGACWMSYYADFTFGFGFVF